MLSTSQTQLLLTSKKEVPLIQLTVHTSTYNKLLTKYSLSHTVGGLTRCGKIELITPQCQTCLMTMVITSEYRVLLNDFTSYTPAQMIQETLYYCRTLCSNLVPHAKVLRLGGEAVGGALPAGPDAAAVLSLALTIAAVFQRARIPKRAVLSELYTKSKD